MKMKNHFKVNFVSVFIIAVLLVVLSGCGLDSDKMKDHFEAGRAGESYEEYMENKNKQETEEAEEETVKEEAEEVEETEPEADDLSDILYADEFKQAFYKDYGAKEGTSDKKGDLIYVRGEILNYEEDQNSLTVSASDGDWVIECGSDVSEDLIKTLKSLKSKEVRVFGAFDGYSKAWEKPVISISKRGADHPCRIETTDDDVRITYLDTRWKAEQNDTDYSLGDFSCKGVSEWEFENNAYDESSKTGNLIFAPLSGYPGSISVDMRPVPDDYKPADADNTDETLDSLEKMYFEGTDIKESKSKKIDGMNAKRVCCSFEVKDEDSYLDSIQYLFTDGDWYCVISFTEPYFIGTNMSEYEDVFMDTVKLKAGSDTSDDKKTDDKKTEDKKTDDKKSEEKKTDDKKKDDSKDTAKETVKTGAPTKEEIVSKLFTQHMEMNVLIDGEVVPASEDFTNAYFSASQLEDYDPVTGEATFWDGEMGGILTFKYNSTGKITYSGTVSMDYEGTKASGTMSGHEM